jgi:hypothetical protein
MPIETPGRTRTFGGASWWSKLKGDYRKMSLGIQPLSVQLMADPEEGLVPWTWMMVVLAVWHASGALSKTATE